MTTYNVACACPLWKANIDKVNAPLHLEQARNPATAKGYTGDRFIFCPWCGARLFLAARAGGTGEKP